MTDYRGDTTGTDLHIAIVTSEFDEKSGGALHELREVCTARLVELGATYDTLYCPGAFEIPTLAAHAITTERYDAIITLGVVVRGETAHFEYVAGECARGVAELARTSGIPVIFGVLTTETTAQAVARISHGADYAEAAVRMANVLGMIER